MNVITRGVKNVLRSPLRSGAIVIMMAVSVGLILSMLVARASVEAKIEQVKASTATTVTVNPAGIKGGMGGGDPLTSEDVEKIRSTDHVSSVAASLTDQLGTDDTTLTPSLELGSFGKRLQRFDSSGSSGPNNVIIEGGDDEARPAPTPRTNVTGTNTPGATIPEDKLTSGVMIDGNSSENIAMIGKKLAEKNSLEVGDTFTAYGKTFTVKAIFETSNMFQDSGIVVPLKTLQTATEQEGAVTAVQVTVDSADNVASTVAALKTTLGDKADITSQEEQAEAALEPLQSIASLATAGVIGASIAATAIIFLAMIMIVRERRREIGVIKAIGGSNQKVISQFIAEGVTLTLIGSIIGLGIGVLASGPMTQSLVSNQSASGPNQKMGQGPVRIMGGPGGFSAATQQLGANVREVTSVLTPQVFASSVGIVIAIAVIGSAAPAWLIARVRPAEVLRTE
ncbi:MAG TPA: FtsX-like permease family protein [Candidatus Saccharimonadales bacterium]